MRYKNRTILYVEDEPGARELLSGFIQRFCGVLHIAKDGEEGLALYKKHDIDIVISDINVPKMNGLDMVEAMKKIHKNQLVIFVTAHIDNEYLFKAIELQVDGYVSKPVDLEKLKVQIEKCILELEAKDSFKKLQESEERARTILETSQLGVFIYKEKYVYVNDIFSEMMGYSKEELYTMDSWSLVEEQNRESIRQIIFRRLQGEKFPLLYQDITLIRKDGRKIVCRVSTQTILHDGGYAGLGTVLNVTDVLETQTRLKLLAQAMEQMDEMVRITDKDGVIVYVNRALLKHTGYREDELIGKSNRLLKSGEHSDSFYKKMYETIQSKKSFQAIFINAKKDGTHYYEDQVITPVLNEESEEIEYYVSTSQDVTEHVQMQEKMRILATTDTLTGIKNRYSINQDITAEVNKLKRYGGTFALMMFDIDYFKKVNDNYGHDRGDYVLKAFTDIVNKSIRDTDTFARWGGEEFLLLVPNIDVNGAMKLAEKIRKNVEKHVFDEVGHITVSIGFSVCNKFSDKDKLLKNIDDALYEAKESGRNRVVYHECSCIPLS